jgi:serine/threonine-protein kinase
MSPEQSSGQHDLDARSDLYALASVSYEMLTGELPFTGPTARSVIARRLSQPAPSVRALRPDLPESVDAALRRALAPVPAERFDTTIEFARALAGAATSAGPRSSRMGRAVMVGAVVMLVGLIALRLLRRPTPPAAGDGAVRLAVLPFRLIGGDSADRYLAEGITEEVTSTLANLGGLRVIDPSSVAPYANSGKTSREIGAALAVNGLIDGVLQKAGDSIRVRVRLIESSSEETKWSQTWDHAARDVFRVQSEVATRVAGVLRIQLAERESSSLARPPTTNPEAYDAYLRALARSRAAGAVRIRRLVSDSIIADLTRAVELDSTFAIAWGQLAAELVGSVFLFDADSARLTQADRAIRIALGRDSTVAIAWKARHDL